MEGPALHRPRRRFGQNFLVDARIAGAILDAIRPRQEDTIAEIGPGRGAITEGLIRSGALLHLVEIDRDLGVHWTARANPRLVVHVADALDFDFGAIAPAQQSLRIAGNLPYNISTPLLFHLLDQSACVRDMHFLLQREVVARLAAAPDCADYGRLSVMIQYRCAVEPLFEVPSHAFHPQPRVVSALVRLRPRAYPGAVATSLPMLSRVVRDAFGQRRKTLRNALGRMLGEAEFAAAGIDASRRAETLSIAEFVALGNVAAARAGGAP